MEDIFNNLKKGEFLIISRSEASYNINVGVKCQEGVKTTSSITIREDKIMRHLPMFIELAQERYGKNDNE